MTDPDKISEDQNYRLLKKLEYDDIVPFVMENIRLRNNATRFYFFINILFLVIIFVLSIRGFQALSFTWGTYFKYLFGGILAGSFLVVPFHEGFHGLAYKIKGAPKIHFGADMKQMLFYVAADKYVVGRKKFYFVALAPFVMINLIGIIFLFFVPIYWHIFIYTFLLMHNIMCIGDFAMVSFFMHHDDKDLYTFDDHKERVSYIYEKVGY